MTIFKPIRIRRGFTRVYTLEVIVDGLFADTHGTYKTLEAAQLDAARLTEEYRAKSA